MDPVAADNTCLAGKEDIVVADAADPSCLEEDPMDSVVPYHCSCLEEEIVDPFLVVEDPFLVEEIATCLVTTIINSSSCSSRLTCKFGFYSLRATKKCDADCLLRVCCFSRSTRNFTEAIMESL